MIQMIFQHCIKHFCRLFRPETLRIHEFIIHGGILVDPRLDSFDLRLDCVPTIRIRADKQYPLSLIQILCFCRY